MKAAVLSSWKNLVIQDIPKPVPGPGQTLLRVIYAGLCGSDITVYKGEHPTATAPVVPCHEIMGVVEAFGGEAPASFRIGDRVTVEPLISCGHCEACLSGYFHVCDTLQLLGIHQNGGFGEYVCVSTSKLVHLPQGLSDKVAALAEPFAVAYHVNHRAGIRAGDKAIVLGCGSIGIPVALAAGYFGAARVVVTEINPSRITLAKRLGLDVHNPEEEDIHDLCKQVTGENRFDVVIDSSGSKTGMLMMPDLCKTRGTMVPLSLSGSPVELGIGKVSFREMQIVGTRVYSLDHFRRGVEMLSEIAKRVDLELLATDTLPLDDVQTGYDRMVGGQNAGKILISCT